MRLSVKGSFVRLVAMVVGAATVGWAPSARADEAAVSPPAAQAEEAAAPTPTPPPPPPATHADEHAASPAKTASEKKDGEWYGSEVLLVDAVSVVAGVATKRWEVFLVGYAAGGPIVHWAHGEVGNGFGSLALRVGAPTILGGLGYAADKASCGPDTWFCGLGGAVLGALGGYVIAETVDIAFIARERPKADDAGAERSRTALRVSPVVAPARGGGSVGVVGSF